MQWSLALMFGMVIAGAACARKLVPGEWLAEVAQSNQLAKVRVESAYHATRIMRSALWASVIVMVVVMMTESQPIKILDYYLSGDSELEKINVRRENSGTPYYLYNVFIASVAPFIVMILWCLHRRRLDDVELRTLFYSFLVLVFVGKLGLLSKAPPVAFILQLALLYYLINKKAVEWRSVTSIAALGVSLLVAVVMLVIPGTDLWEAIEFLRYRIFDIPNEGLLEYHTAFPERIPHGWEYGPFGSYSRFTNEGVAPNYFLVSELTRGSQLSSSNVMFVGDAWADYAWPGVIVVSFLAGLIPRCIDYYSFRNRYTDEWACIMAGCSFGVFTMLCTAMTTAMVTGGLLLIPFVSFLFTRRCGSQNSEYSSLQRDP